MKYYARGLKTDVFIGEIDLGKEPGIGETIVVSGKELIVKDKSIGQRQVDELYVISSPKKALK